ncbi:MAG: phenylalanine--tRNA ligase subunit beta [Maricaulaceae bacterium]
MKFTVSWLKDHLDYDLDLEALLEAMTMAGLEVEGVENPGEALKAFTTATVLAAEPHPDADRLRVCQVETQDGVKQIVCGAPNARAGMTAIYAPLGSYIPGLEFALDAKPRKIRGVESHGMMCSTKELELGEDHEGIADLPGDWAVGTPAAQALGVDDPVIDFEVTPNRPDWLGVEGIARDLAAAGVGRFTPQAVTPVPGAFPCPVEIKIDAPEACPVFAGRVVRGLTNGPSPDWFQARLRAIGLRPINALVDITNYLSYDRARPLHVYDADKLQGPIRARLGREGEAFLALDGKTYAVSPDMCAIADDSGVLGLGGVMGGESTGSTDATTAVFIESAYFDPIRTALPGRTTTITSDAQYRFARGVDPGFVVPGLELATRLIMEFCGGEASEIAVAGEVPSAPAPFVFDLGQVKRLTGLTLSEAQIADYLDAMGVGHTPVEGGFEVRPPSWRPDLTQSADLVEDVARLHGYDNLPETKLRHLGGRRAAAESPERARARIARRVMAARGAQEAIVWSFCKREEAALFGGGDAALLLANPISSELDCMRPSALPHLITAAQKNADRGYPDVALFEVGPVYAGDQPADQTQVLAVVRRSRPARHWSGAQAEDVFTVKADALAVLAALEVNTDQLQTVADARDVFHPGRSGQLRMGPKRVLAEFGELHPRVLKALDADGPVFALEVFLDALPAKKAKPTRSKGAAELASLQPVTRDFAFLVTDDTPAQAVVQAARGADKGLIADVRVFDVYAGEGVEPGHRSLAIEVTLQPKDKTLTDAEIDAVAQAVIKAVEAKSGGRLRG